MSYLYLIDSNVKVGFRQGETVITHLVDGSEQRMPFAEIEGVSVFGMVQLSTRFVRECISSNVPVCYYSDNGHYFGMTSSSLHVNPVRQKRQVYLTDDEEFCLQWARTVVDAKIRNSLALLESFDAAYSLTEEDTEGLRHSLANLQYAETVDMANGFEGNAAKCYFRCLSKAIQPAGLKFRARSTRPPKDPFNSMLSFGYSILYRNIIGAIERHGLHPYFAFMHRSRLGHAALASDLIEELRAPLVDRVVMELANSGEVDEDDFEPNESGAVYMKRGLMRRLTSMISETLVKGRPFFSAYGDSRSYGFQVMLDRKIDSAIDAIDNGDAALYNPYIWETET